MRLLPDRAMECAARCILIQCVANLVFQGPLGRGDVKMRGRHDPDPGLAAVTVP